jgi:hypothetical protein
MTWEESRRYVLLYVAPGGRAAAQKWERLAERAIRNIASEAATKELTQAAVFGRDCVVVIQIPMNTVTIPAGRF